MNKFYLGVAAIAAAAMLGLTGCQQTAKTTEGSEASKESAPKGAIVYFNLDKVFQEYDMANDLRSVVETKVNSINEEVNRRGTKLQNDINDFQNKIDKGLLTRSTAEVQNQQLSQRQSDFQNYASQKQQEVAEEQQVMMNQILNAINDYVKKYNEEKGYAMIIANQGDILSTPVVIADSTLDVTDSILEGLNAEYVKTKAATK